MKFSVFVAPKSDRRLSQDVVLLGIGSTMHVVRSQRVLKIEAQPAPGCLIVADGLGGHPRGRLAAALCVTEFGREHPVTPNAESIRNVLAKAHQKCVNLSQLAKLRRPMGASVGGVIWDRRSLVVFVCGDVLTFQGEGSSGSPMLPHQRKADEKLDMCVGGDWDVAAIEPIIHGPELIADFSARKFCTASDGVWTHFDAKTMISNILGADGDVHDGIDQFDVAHLVGADDAAVGFIDFAS